MLCLFHVSSKVIQLYICSTIVVLSCFSRAGVFETLWMIPHQAPPSMGFSDWNNGEGCHFPLQGIFLT